MWPGWPEASCLDQAGLKPAVILSPLPPKGDYRGVSSQPGFVLFLFGGMGSHDVAQVGLELTTPSAGIIDLYRFILPQLPQVS